MKKTITVTVELDTSAPDFARVTGFKAENGDIESVVETTPFSIEDAATLFDLTLRVLNHS